MSQLQQDQLVKPAVGMKEIAARAGVSIATVSMALSNCTQVNEGTRRRIWAISRQLDYQPPRRVGRSRTAKLKAKNAMPERIGFLLLGSRLQDNINQDVLQALTINASMRDIRMEVYCVESAGRIATERHRLLDFAKGVNAVILTGFVDTDLLDHLEAAEIPHVVFGPFAGGFSAVFSSRHGKIVTPDAVAMGELATSTLVGEGHRRIGFICSHLTRGLWNERWLRGYRHALLDAGLALDDSLVHVTNNSPDTGRSAVDAFATLKAPPSAYVIPGMTSAVEFMAAMRARHQEVSPRAIIVGGHDQSFHRFGLAGCRIIGCDIDQAAELLIHEVTQLYRQPMPCPTQVLLPFHILDLAGSR